MRSVSVVIPTYNHALFLREAVDSVLAQTVAPVEIIVVDDGSSDETPAILASYGDRIRVIRQENGGVAVARNTGIVAARGELLAFLDSDDVWLPRKLELQLQLFDRDPDLGLVHSAVEDFDESGALGVSIGLEGWVAADLLRLDRLVVRAPGSSVVVPKRVAEEVGGYDRRLPPSEDWDFCYRVALRYRFGCVSEPLVRYRLHGGGIHMNIAGMENGMLLAFEKAFASPDPAVQALRRESYGRLHRILAGCYFQTRRRGDFVRHAVKSLRYDPRNFGYLAAWPWRRFIRTRPTDSRGSSARSLPPYS